MSFETHFYGEDMAMVISSVTPQLADTFHEVHPAVVRRMNDILNHPERPVNLRTADAIVTAIGIPHVLTNGAVRVAEGYNRKQGLPIVPQNNDGTVLWLPAPPFRKWLERQSRHYKTLTAMYQDLELTTRQGSSIWRGQVKQVQHPVVEVAMDRRGCVITQVYPQFRILADA